MSEATPSPNLNIGKLILIPSLITLGVSVLRLLGELQQWSPILFGRTAGGGGALIGISWLPLILGPYFAWKLVRAGQGPAGCGRAIGYAVLGLGVFFAGASIAFGQPFTATRQLLGYLVMAAAVLPEFVCWRSFAKTLLAYAYAARIPVVVIMYFAIQGNWGTHYDALPPDVPVPADPLARFAVIGLLPQLIFWVVYTVIVGGLLGSIFAALVHRRPAPVSTS